MKIDGPSTTSASHAIWRGVATTIAMGACLALPSLQLQAQTSIPAPPGMVAWWPGDGNGNDIFGTNIATLNNGTSFGPGLVGQSFSLDGIDDFIVAPNGRNLNPATQITVEAWYRPVSFVGMGNNAIVDKVYSSQTVAPPYYQYHLGVTGDQYVRDQAEFTFSVAVGGNAASVSTPQGTWTPWNWYHVVGTYDGSNVMVYVNGTLRGSIAASGSLTDYGNPVTIGGFWNAGAVKDHTPGLIDEVCVYSRALSSDEIAGIYAAGAAGKCKDPLITQHPQTQIGYWGKSVNFSVSAKGTAPLRYQWFKDGTLLAGATNATLDLPNLQATNSGAYSVTVSNSVASVTTYPAQLSVSPVEMYFGLYPGMLINGVVGQTYGIQSTATLSDTNSWMGITNITLTTPTYLWYDSQPATRPQHFYRVVPGPIPVP